MKTKGIPKNVVEGKKSYYESIELYNVGKLDEAIIKGMRAVELLKDDLLSKETALAYNVLGITYNVKCNELVAMNYYLDGIDIAISTQNVEALLKIYNNMVLCLMKIEDYDNSLYYIEKCLEVIKKYRIEDAYTAVIRANAAIIYMKANKQSKAYEQYRLSKAAFDVHKSEAFYFSILLLKIMVRAEESKEKRQKLYQDMMVILEERPLTIRELEILLYCIDQFFLDGELDKAERCLSYIEKISHMNGISQGLFKVYEYQMELCRIKGDLEQQKEVALKYAVQSNYDFKHMSKMISESITERVKYKTLQRHHSQMKKKAMTDSLTGLYNRHCLTSLYEKGILQNKGEQHLIGIAVIDIDHFKEYNDLKGHVFGDECLKGVANVLKGLLDGKTFVLRYGGDEFMILFNNQTKEEIITKLKVTSQMVGSLGITRPSNPEEKLSITQGVYIDKKENIEDLVDFIRHADNALYKGKQKRGSICIKDHEEDILLV